VTVEVGDGVMRTGTLTVAVAASPSVIWTSPMVNVGVAGGASSSTMVMVPVVVLSTPANAVGGISVTVSDSVASANGFDLAVGNMGVGDR
jgi:hypothetical protein